MARKILYQTLTDRNNPEIVHTQGPFACYTDDAWLGHGYYFWDTFEDLSHFWGKVKVKGPYIVCKAECDFKRENIFDLHGEPEDIALFHSISKLIDQQKLDEGDAEETTVSDILYYIKTVLGIAHWAAIRVNGILSISPYSNQEYVFRKKFILGESQFLDMMPPVQICIFNLDILGFKNWEIIYPSKYVLAG